MPAFPRRSSVRVARAAGGLLACRILLALAGPWFPTGEGGRAVAEDPAAASASIYQGGGTGDASDEAGRAERIVAAALAGLARHPSVFARLRQMALVGGMEMFGAGLYEQSGLGEEQRFRFEASLTVGADDYDLLEVCDGLSFWSYQKNADLAATVHRVDARRVRQAVAPAEAGGSLASEAITRHLGGVQRTLALIRDRFRFASVESADIDGMPVWRIEGRWDREELSKLVPSVKSIAADAAVPPEALPQGLPWSVTLSLGKRELFPFRIEWFAGSASRGGLERVALLELYDVRIGEPVDATAFVYRPATGGQTDVTDAFIAGLRRLRP